LIFPVTFGERCDPWREKMSSINWWECGDLKQQSHRYFNESYWEITYLKIRNNLSYHLSGFNQICVYIFLTTKTLLIQRFGSGCKSCLVLYYSESSHFIPSYFALLSFMLINYVFFLRFFNNCNYTIYTLLWRKGNFF
jgi:hypothetical protein